VSRQEERRLFYVAMTRARKRLFLTYVVTDTQRQLLSPSRFLRELPQNLLAWQGGYGHSANQPPVPETLPPAHAADGQPGTEGNVAGGRNDESGLRGGVDSGAGGAGGVRYTVNGEGMEGAAAGQGPQGAEGGEQSAAGIRFLQR
jgi:hypothetical protein